MAAKDPRSAGYPAPGEPLSPIQQAANIGILKRNLAIGLVVACPILIALPPRKLDVYTFCLAGTTFISANHLIKYHTGRSIMNRIGINSPDSGDKRPMLERAAHGQLPTERARQYQALMKEKKEAELAGRKWVPPQSIDDVKPVVEEEKKGVLESVWMGKEGEDWKAKRDRKEREALERGDGVGTLIQDYFAEAMGWKKDDEDDVEEKK